MKPPRIEGRRTPQFAAELLTRARAWIPAWGLADGEQDFGRALLDVAARFSSEVAERLDRAGDKMQRGLLDFLAVRGEAARPARMPVVFKLADTAVDPVLATAPVQMQVDAAGATVVFETESDVRVLPGRMEVVAGVDADADAVYLPPPGLHDLEPLKPQPAEWQLKSFAAAGAKTLQVDPEAGLAVDLVVEGNGLQYRLAKVDKEIVTIEPPLDVALAAGTILRKVTVFAPFDGKTRNRQEHALYLGQLELFDVETPATIDIVGGQSLDKGVAWQYWGTAEGSDVVDWQPLKLAPDQQEPDALVLIKPKGKIEPREIGGVKSRYIRAFTTNVPTGQLPSRFDELAVRINAVACSRPDVFPATPSPAAEGMANTTPLVMDQVFFPLGREPRLFDAFYLACPEAFSKAGAKVQLSFDVGDGSFESLAYVRSAYRTSLLSSEPLAHRVFAGVSGDGFLHVLRFDADTGVTRDALGPQRPPSPEDGGRVVDEPQVALDPRPNYRPAMWRSGSDLLVAVAAGGTVWVWHQAGADPQKSGWKNFGEVGPVHDSKSPITGIVHLVEDNHPGWLFVLREKKLFFHDLSDADPAWNLRTTTIGLQSIVPICEPGIDGLAPGKKFRGLVGVGVDRKLYTIDVDNGASVKVRDDEVAPEIVPAATIDPRSSVGDVLVYAVEAAAPGQTTRRILTSRPADDEQLPGIGVIGHSIDINLVAELVTIALCVRTETQGTGLVSWRPTEIGVPAVDPIPAADGIAGGSPSVLPIYALVPAASGQVLVAQIHFPLNDSVTVLGGSGLDWKAYLEGSATSGNPVLSWEYANGTGWWKLDPLFDETLNLRRSGNVRFTVPDDLRPMDWAGRTSLWIRARLVGGDFGKEVVKVKITTNGDTTQTIERSTAGIRAPSVLKLRIAYKLCQSTRPTFVLAQDSGSIRDQSDANRTRGAVVEAFVPLAVSLGRFLGPSAPAATGRALFAGLNATPSGAPVNVLLLVDQESPHEVFAPMKIEGLVADRLVTVVAEDTTRALGESGLLSMAFALAPTPRELFGFENLTWLRLAPTGDAPVSGWKPNVRGAYLNAVFAGAAETLTRELLGSSEGEPDLTLFLARPPVLRDTLELRVREPLGDEERDQLRDRVLHDEDLPGDWVLWKQVLDPGDEPAAARVYALDEATGEIRFGDGQHGAIPPIGVDSIVAFRYQRTELGTAVGSDVPGNAVAARTGLGLVSPVDTVEAVFAADHAAGGAPPESDERVVRFGTARLRHRKRAVTAGDFEDLALESSPGIVQARCFAGRGRVRLVVVMRGKDPLPNAAQVRELRRLLLAAAPASLAAPHAFQITGPRIRRLQILLTLRVATLDHAGEVSRAVQQRIEAIFDTTRWPLGREPKEEDITLAIIDTPHLEGIASISLHEVLSVPSVPSVLSVLSTVLPDHLVMLDADPLRLAFETVEVIS